MRTSTPHHPTSRRFSFALALAALLAMPLAAIPAPSQSPPQPAAAPQAATTPTPPLAFDVASVRLSAPNGPRPYINDLPSNRFTATNEPLSNLIRIAYGAIGNNRITAPEWLSYTHYDIAAQIEGDTKLTHEQMMPLLRRLLEERFHLVVHHEEKVVPGYELVVAKGGPKLNPTKGAKQYGYFLSNELRFQNVSIKEIAAMLGGAAGGAGVDKTGITGNYDIDLKFAPENVSEGSADAALPSIFTAVQEQLGLKLVPQKVPIDTLVIDHVDRIPTEN
ncbi:MAG: TIGR03435 family protein [Acidobacteriaceae bacterium]